MTAPDIEKVAQRAAFMFHCQMVIVNDELTRCELPMDCGDVVAIEAANPDLVDHFFDSMSASDRCSWVRGELSLNSADPTAPEPTTVRLIPLTSVISATLAKSGVPRVDVVDLRALKKPELKARSDVLCAGVVSTDLKATAKAKVESRFRNMTMAHTGAGAQAYATPRLPVADGTKLRLDEDRKWFLEKAERKDWVSLPTEPDKRWILQDHVLAEFLSRSVETKRPVEEQRGRIVRNIVRSHLAPGAVEGIFNSSMITAEVQASMPAHLVRTVMLKVLTTSVGGGSSAKMYEFPLSIGLKSSARKPAGASSWPTSTPPRTQWQRPTLRRRWRSPQRSGTHWVASACALWRKSSAGRTQCRAGTSTFTT